MESHLQRETSCLARTDWLASELVFYLADGSACSRSAGELIRTASNLEIHPEGLYNYLDYGYSVFSQTPVKQLMFMPPCAELVRRADGGFACESGPDPYDQIDRYRLSESDLIDLVRHKVQEWERGLPGDQEIVLPLSGGYDSRFLLWCLKDPSRVRAYTYGGSTDQTKSEDVVYARALAERFNIRWEHVPLIAFNDYMDRWIDEFGPATHAHGMYHYEFFTHIRRRLTGRHALLSGIFGDVWAGSIPPISNLDVSKLASLGYTHGLKADRNAMLVPIDHALRDGYWAEHKERLTDPRYQIVTTIRLKIILISYLFRVPRLFNLEPWTPFLEPEVALAMLNLPQARRNNRQWQRDFFQTEGLDLENQKIRGNRSNTLNLNALRNKPLEPLGVEKLSRWIDPDYVHWVNREIRPGAMDYLRGRIAALPRAGAVFRRLGLGPATVSAYSAYCCLKPLERLSPCD